MTSTTSLSDGTIGMLMLGQETEGIESDLREIHKAWKHPFTTCTNLS